MASAAASSSAVVDKSEWVKGQSHGLRSVPAARVRCHCRPVSSSHLTVRARAYAHRDELVDAAFLWRNSTMTVSSGENFAESKGALVKLAPPQAVLFDVDGTLCDSDPLHHYAFREMLQEIGYNGGVPITEEFFIQNIAGRHNDDIAAVLFPNDLPRGIKFCEDKEAMFRKLASEQLKPLNGLDKVKKWIEDRGLKRAAVTNAPRANAELMISKVGLSDFFDAVIIGSECEHAKPHPAPYLKALEILNVSKDHTFVFEDSASGIKAGVAAGMPVVGLTTRNPEHLLMEARPAFLVKDYADPKLWAALDELDKHSSTS